MSGKIKTKTDINWPEINKPFYYKYILKPGETFAFHDNILENLESKNIRSAKAHFNFTEGFLTDGFLYGNGVCHLASLINWTALDAGLSTTVPVNHNFAVIPGIPQEFGVSISTSPYKTESSQRQNLYIENTIDEPVKFTFEYNLGILNFSISKI